MFKLVTLFVVAVNRACTNLAVDMESHVDGARGAAARRRQRGLRAQLRHEQQSVAMALAVATHHSAPRRPKTARVGVRPGVLEDPGLRRETEHELYAALRGPKPPSLGVPSLATPLLALCDSSLRFGSLCYLHFLVSCDLLR